VQALTEGRGSAVGDTRRNGACLRPQERRQGVHAPWLLVEAVTQEAPAKKKRFGKDALTGEDKWVAAKPVYVRSKLRPLKRLKNAAL
jgi:hypothetical protein